MQAALSAYLNPRRPILLRFSQEIGASFTNRFPSWSGIRLAPAIRRFSVPETNDQRSTRWLDPLTNESHTTSVYDTARMMTRESTHRKEVLSFSLSRSLCLLLSCYFPSLASHASLATESEPDTDREKERGGPLRSTLACLSLIAGWHLNGQL